MKRGHAVAAAGVVLACVFVGLSWNSRSPVEVPGPLPPSGDRTLVAVPVHEPLAVPEDRRPPEPVEPPVPGVQAKVVAPKAPRPVTPAGEYDLAVRFRAGLGGTIESAAERLHRGRTLDDWWGTERDIYWGWGTEGVLRAITLWQDGLGPEPVPNRGALWLARSQAEGILGREKESAAHLVDAVLAMEREKLQVGEGEPRLLAFALPPNSAPIGPDEWDEKRWAQASWRNPDFARSGGAGWGGGSGLVWEGDGRKYFAFVLQVAATDSPPEEAMAATLWAHAVEPGWLGYRSFPHGLPPAALRYLKRQEVQLPPEEAALDWWHRVFEEAWSAALERQDSAAERLKSWRERMQSLQSRHGASTWRADQAALSLWSLGEEFRDRFAAVDTPKARQLRELAELLLR